MRRLVALVASLAALAAPSTTFALAPQVPGQGPSERALRVIRTSPATDASPATVISVTFDRPVAGSLDNTVDPRTVLSVQPQIAGKLEWRDPVTIRLTPATPLASGASYTVSVSNAFQAMDGSRLPAPHSFTFRVQGPTLLTGAPIGEGTPYAAHLLPNQRIELVYSAPVDLAALTASVYAEFSASCAGSPRAIVRYRAVSQRAVAQNDPGRFRYAVSRRAARGERRGEDVRGPDTLRRVVLLQPTSPMPYGCNAELVAPGEIGANLPPDYVRMAFATHGALQLSSVSCAYGNEFCASGPLLVTFTNPVKGAQVERHLRLYPATSFTVRDTSAEAASWVLDAKLTPRTNYAIAADTALRDVFGQKITGNPARGFATTGYNPAVGYAFGKQLVERVGLRTLAVQHTNVDTLHAIVAAVPDSLEAEVLGTSWGGEDTWTKIFAPATRRTIPVPSAVDRALFTGIPLPGDGVAPATVYAVRVNGRSGGRPVVSDGPVSIVQITDLGVHARIGKTEGTVWVTSVNTGAAKAGANVTLYDAKGRLLARGTTDARGLARLRGWGGAPTAPAEGDEGESYSGAFEGYVKVSSGDDRAVASLTSWDPDLSPWRFNVYSAYGDDRYPLSGTVFTERGIYRPGEKVHAKAIIRHGLLGALRAPPARDSVKWIFRDREDGVLREVVAPLSAFGTAHESIDLPGGAALGTYWIEVRAHMQGDWRTVDRVAYRVAEYRPPEFLVDATPAAGSSLHFPGDTFSVAVQARYLFGAPMGRAALTWHAQQTALYSWDLDIPNTDGWHVGESGSWWRESQTNTMVMGSGVDTLDARGERTISVRLPEPARGRAARATLQATVQDVNRQVVAASATTLLHPAEFYIAAKPLGTSYFWTAGTPVTVAIKTVRPDGESVAGVPIMGIVVRREWHRVRRVRDGIPEVVGEWVSDTVTRCSITTTAGETTCSFTPRAGGIFSVSFTASDSKGRRASTSFERWVAGKDWVPWNDESQFKMDVIPDRTRYSVGDTATILFASPFTDAEAWITVEREGIIEQRRLRITSGSTTLKFPITEAYSPNAFVSIVVARGRSAPPGPLDDPGRPTIRVGYAELRVTPEVKRLRVALRSDKTEYLPGDSARVSIEVRDVRGGGPRAEVTLWAVDEGVLSLTGYKTPDPIDLIYKARGLGLRLASNMTAVAPQVPEGEKGRREPGGGGGGANADVLRSRFQTTAFFLASVVTDANGNATASAKLPDNLTTFRLMAVAVTAGDRYGSGEAKLLVTRPLLARAALPRFVRGGDQLQAGAVINRRDGAAVPVTVKAAATGVRLDGPAERSVTLDAGRGSEVRFGFNAPPGDSASFRFDVTDGANADAVRVAIPVRPDYHPQATVVAGVLRDTVSVEMLLPSNIDPARSTLTLTIGGSPLASIRGMARDLRVYPYYCTEQLISTAVPLIAMTRLQSVNPPIRNPLGDIARAVEMLSRRQRADGGIGYWSNTDWTSPWLSSYAGIVLLDARDVGVPVDSMVLERLAGYVTNALRDPSVLGQVTAVSSWFARADVTLGERVAAVDFLSRLNRPAIAMENELLRNAPQLSLENRARLAEVMMRRGEKPAALLLMVPTWAQVSVEGRTAQIPDSVSEQFYFRSEIRPLARILSATLAVEPDHRLVGPLVEAIAQQGRALADRWSWNTQDYSSAVTALAAYDRLRMEHGNRAVQVRSNGRSILAVTPSRVPAERAMRGLQLTDSVIPLRGLLTRVQGGQALRLSLDAGPGDGAVYYYLTVNEIPATQPVTVEERGIRVERWYEDVRTRQPVQSVTEGDLVRVRLRVTVPATRSFVVVDDALPAGLEAVDLSLRGASLDPGPGLDAPLREDDSQPQWRFGRWDGGWWSAFDHREMRDDRVVYSATLLWPGSYTATYLARATTPGTFIKPPAHAEEMYNPGVHGRSEGGTFVVRPRSR